MCEIGPRIEHIIQMFIEEVRNIHTLIPVRKSVRRESNKTNFVTKGRDVLNIRKVIRSVEKVVCEGSHEILRISFNKMLPLKAMLEAVCWSVLIFEILHCLLLRRSEGELLGYEVEHPRRYPHKGLRLIRHLRQFHPLAWEELSFKHPRIPLLLPFRFEVIPRNSIPPRILNEHHEIPEPHRR